LGSSRLRFAGCVSWAVVLLASFACATVVPHDESTVADLKARIASAGPSERAHLCVQIAQKQLDQADKLYAAADTENAQVAMTDVVTYSELARDYSIQSHKYEKQAEIALREMTRKLNTLLHTLAHEEQAPVKEAVSHLERARDDLLAAMFKKGAK
jgi:hypothetical protein